MSTKTIPNPPVHPFAGADASVLNKWLNQDAELLGKILHLHLCLEEVITNSCRIGMSDPTALHWPKCKKMFHDKLLLLEELYGEAIQPTVYTFAKKLNSFRNKLAHGNPELNKLDELAKLQAYEIKDTINSGMPSSEVKYSKGQESIAIEGLVYQVHRTIVGILNGVHAEDIPSYETEMHIWMEHHIRSN